MLWRCQKTQDGIGRRSPCKVIPIEHTFSAVLLQRASTYLLPPMLVEEGRKMEEREHNGETERMETDNEWQWNEEQLFGWDGNLRWQRVHETEKIKHRIINKIQFMHLSSECVWSCGWRRPRPSNGMKAHFLCKLQQWLIYVGKNFNAVIQSWDMLLPSGRAKMNTSGSEWSEGSRCCHH